MVQKRVNGITVKRIIGNPYESLYANLSSLLILTAPLRLRKLEINTSRYPSKKDMYKLLNNTTIDR